MKIGLLLCTYNRPAYLKQTLDSLNRADLSNVDLLIVDDASTDAETLALIEPYNKIKGTKNLSIRYSLKVGFDYFFKKGYDIVINLDSDALVRNDFVSVMMQLHERFPDRLITGFNCNTLSLHGLVRHPIVEHGEGYNVKESVGGINMLVTKALYESAVKPALEFTLKHKGNWDHEACKRTNGVVCAVPSVIQHIGFHSSMGHTGIEPPDVADDFKELSLPNVTLIGIDCKDINRLLHAFDESTKNIEFGSVRILSSIEHDRVTDIIKPIKSKEEYSEFCIKELYKFIDTDYCLIIQYDGYVKNHHAWTNEFLKYDYIGAPWEWHPDRQVGNGGFSLRSKKLHEYIASEKKITILHPEDNSICREYAHLIEAKGMKFAPIEVARKFSIEGYKADKTYRGQFGFHGTDVRFHKSEKKMCVLQPFGLGDVIFSQTLVHSLGDYHIIWPVKDHYVDELNRAYPDIEFISEKHSPVKLNLQSDRIMNGYRAIPIRWSMQLQRVPYTKVMRAKYDMYRKDWTTWKDRAMWVRDLTREDRLFQLLGLEGKKYTLINSTFGCDFGFKVDIEVDGVQVRKIEGYSLFDWAKVFENAEEIHTVSTSILFILDQLKTGDVHVYIRRPQEMNHNNYNYIFTNPKFIYH